MGRGLVESGLREKTHLWDGTTQRKVKKVSPHTVYIRTTQGPSFESEHVQSWNFGNMLARLGNFSHPSSDFSKATNNDFNNLTRWQFFSNHFYAIVSTGMLSIYKWMCENHLFSYGATITSYCWKTIVNTYQPKYAVALWKHGIFITRRMKHYSLYIF